MSDYLEIFEKFKDIKEIFELCDEVQKLRCLFHSGQYKLMEEHINTIRMKYLEESTIWNRVNKEPPQTYDQAYINAEKFLCFQGVKLIVEKITDYKKRLTPSEILFIESMIKPME